MLRGLYTASTALEQATRGLNVISNNLANINTTGFKKDISMYEEFKSKLMYRMGGSEFYDLQKPIKVEETVKNGIHEIKTTDGFFRINAVHGVSYNKEIALRRDDDGYLKTYYRNSNGSIIEGKGYKVLGKNGPIKIEEDKEFSVDKDGNLLVDGNIIDNLVIDRPLGVIGTMSGGIKLMRTVVNYEQGEFMVTHNPLDLAFSGKGFFAVETDRGIRYTRDGSFKLDSEGTLKTDGGFEVQGINGKITGLKGNVGINEFGEITMDGEIVDKLSTFNPKRTEFLKKDSGNFYRYETEIEDDEKELQAKIVQGVLEGSNVNAVEEMVKMIETYRAYESAQKVVRAYDDSIGRAVNDIAKL